MEIVEEGSPFFDEGLGDYPLVAKIIQSDFFKWDPKGKTKLNSSQCDPLRWQTQVMQTPLSDEHWSRDFEKFLHECDSHWETGRQGLLVNMLGMISLKMHPNRYPYGRHVIFNLPNGVKLKGLLAMKTDSKKRPLILFRTGIFSNTQEFYPERFLFFQMFEQSPFNVLVLESSSGSEFLKHNSSYAIGGFDEGLQNFLIARQLQKPEEPLSKYISDVHMMGLSMGGHGALFTALVNQANPQPGGKPVIQSALAFCPLMNMQETLDYHMSHELSMHLMNYYASRRLQILNTRIPDLKEGTFIPQFLSWMQENYKGPLVAEEGKVPGVLLPPGMQEILDQNPRPGNLFWRLNHFWPWYRNVKTPVVIFSTEKDPIVSWFINAGRVQDQRMNFQDSNLRMFSFKQGYHCSLPVAYDWGSLTTLFQTFVMKSSPSLRLVPKQVRVPLDQSVLEKIKGKNLRLQLDFEVPEKTSALKAQVRFDEQADPGILARFLAPKAEASLPLNEMEFPIEGIVRDRDEASLLRRWAYQNVKVALDGSDLLFTWKITQ